VKGSSGNWWVTINFVYERQTKNVELMAVCAIDFGNHAVIADSRHSIYSFFNGDCHVDHEDLGDSSTCDRLFLAFYFVS